MVATPAAPDSNEDLIVSGLEAQSAATAAASAVAWDSASTTWGQGDGLNGDVLRPDSLDDLTDILDRVEFDASIDSDSYLRHSTLESRIYAFDQDGNELFHRNSWNHADAGGDPDQSGGVIFNSAVYTDSDDTITTSQPYSSTFIDSANTYVTSEEFFESSAGYSTDVEYGGNLKNGSCAKFSKSARALAL